MCQMWLGALLFQPFWVLVGHESSEAFTTIINTLNINKKQFQPILTTEEQVLTKN